MTALAPAPFADLLAGYCLEVQGGETALVRSTSLAAPLLLELQRALLERDAWPLLRVELPGQTRSFYDAAGSSSLTAPRGRGSARPRARAGSRG